MLFHCFALSSTERTSSPALRKGQLSADRAHSRRQILRFSLRVGIIKEKLTFSILQSARIADIDPECFKDLGSSKLPSLKRPLVAAPKRSTCWQTGVSLTSSLKYGVGHSPALF